MTHQITLIPGDGIGLMLRFLNESAIAVMRALGAVLVDGSVRTRDMGGRATTTEYTAAICRHINGRGAC